MLRRLTVLQIFHIFTKPSNHLHTFVYNILAVIIILSLSCSDNIPETIPFEKDLTLQPWQSAELVIELHPDKIIQFSILSLSKNIQSQLRLSKIPNDYEYIIGDYVIYSAKRPWNDWGSLLEVRPYYMAKDHGFRKVVQKGDTLILQNQTVFPPDNWLYRQEGTATMIFPPESVQKEIFRLLRKRGI